MLGSLFETEDHTEKTIDVLALQLSDLCGLQADPFSLSSCKGSFKMFGLSTISMPDLLALETESNVLIILFEDKNGTFRSDGYLGQIVSELLLCHYQNLSKDLCPDTVFLIRVFKHFVSMFSMPITKTKLKALCEKGELIDGEFINLYSDTATPTTNPGYNLCVQNERNQAIMLIAAIRQHCIQRLRH
jgi:hypothetical protein